MKLTFKRWICMFRNTYSCHWSWSKMFF